MTSVKVRVVICSRRIERGLSRHKVSYWCDQFGEGCAVGISEAETVLTVLLDCCCCFVFFFLRRSSCGSLHSMVA